MFIFGFLLSSLPFVLPLRDPPNGDFYSDAVSCFLVFFAISFIFKKFSFGRDSWFLILFACAFLMSGFLMGGYYLDVWFFPAVALLMAAALVSALRACKQEQGDKFFLGVIYGLLVGGSLSVLIALLQVHGFVGLLGGLVFPGANEVYANFGQRNNFSTYIMCFSVAASWLACTGRLRFWLFLLAMCSSAYVLAFAGSRMVLLDSLLLIFVLVFFLVYNKSESSVSSFSMHMLVFLILVGCFQLGLFFWGAGGASRITLSVDVARIDEWTKAWTIFVENPFGVGIGGYAKNSFIYEIGGAAGGKLTWVHAHNIVVQFLVELGVFSLPFFFCGGWLLLLIFKRCLAFGVKGLVLVSCVLVMLVHSLLEYPLWYMNFFFLFFALIGSVGAGVDARAVSAQSLRLTSFFLGLFLCFSVYGYLSFSAYSAPVKDMEANAARMGAIIHLGNNPALAWSADKLAVEYLVEDDGPELDYKLCQAIGMAVREPHAVFLERIALLAIAGQDFDFASQVLKSRYAVYPDMPDTYLVARIKLLWPSYASEFISKIERERLAGFPSYDYYRLSTPERCL
ncbi:Wzy polymerase domain-containing protein [Pseudomonas leptonychotis]|uniref:PglL family O-oligosaccharyltransferase n=1 Tax=Pseudomonas leptonychotis TaxID=2448482 RepID=UPI003869833C